MSLSTSAITGGIAALSVSGVTIKDITGIPDQVQGRDCPIFYPDPDVFMQGGAGAGEGLSTFGAPTARMWLFNRTMRYIYLHAPAGSERGIYVHYAAMCAKADAIAEALTALNVTQVDVLAISWSSFGVLQDAAGASFYGFTLDITLREKVNP